MGEVLGHQVSRPEAMTLPQREALLRERIRELGAAADAAAPKRLAQYHELLRDWNTRMNLTGDTDFGVMLDRHFMDSLAPLAIAGLFPQGASLIDVGSGAGFPGMALAIARPDLRVTLLDSLGKRIAFLTAVKEALGLGNVRLMHARAEDAARSPDLREQFDLAVARAVAPLPVLCELLLPFVRVGGRMACYKGPAAAEEAACGQRAARLLGGGALETLPVSLPGLPDWNHLVIACPKEQKTVRQYPRKAGLPARAPLGADAPKS